ncbi:hypothetical protein MycrhDRAFT_6892 [Mycolicibacterium rhodesiae JS60]|nr:hypothetical protein MycrhDRAFT_6892 [Mycolicibacterium rhodesiae JS60]
MTDNSFLKFYKSGVIGIVLTAAAQIFLGVKTGNQELFITGAGTAITALWPYISQKRLSAQVATGVLTEKSPTQVIADAASAAMTAKANADAEIEQIKSVLEPLGRQLEPLLKDFLK